MSVLTAIPPRIDEIPAAAVALLDVASMQSLLGGTGRVVRRDQVLPVLSTTAVGRIVVFLRDQPGGTYADMVGYADVQVRVDVLRVAGMDAGKYLGRVHREVFDKLAGQSLTLSYAGVSHPLTLLRKPSAAMEHQEGYFYSSAVYRMVVKPA